MNKDRRPIFQPNELSADAVVSMRTRIITAIIAIAVVAPVILFGDWAFFILMSFVLVLGVIEVVRCAKRKYSKVLYITASVLALLVLWWSVLKMVPDKGFTLEAWKTWRLFDSYQAVYMSATIMFIGICLASFTMLIDKGFTIIDACFIFTIVFIVALGFQSALVLRYYPMSVYHQSLQASGQSVPYFNVFDNLESSMLILFVVAGACLNDAFAYFVGVFFGRHKMIERVSPKKTWEGFFGGVILTSIFLSAWAFILAAVDHGNHAILKGLLDLEHWYHIIILSILIPLVSVLGDLVFSSIKRYYGIKDFSNVLPGHGGILDRMDSIVFALTTCAIYLSLFDFWGGSNLV